MLRELPGAETLTRQIRDHCIPNRNRVEPFEMPILIALTSQRTIAKARNRIGLIFFDVSGVPQGAWGEGADGLALGGRK